MKKLWRKVIPLLMAAAVLTLGVTVCAETTATLELSYATDSLVVTSTAEVKITGIPEKSTTTEETTYYDVSFTTYQVVYAEYDSTTNTITYKLTDWAKSALVDSSVSSQSDYGSDSGYSATAGKYSSEKFALAALYALATSNTDATSNSNDQETLVNTLAACSGKMVYSSASWTQINNSASATLPVGVYLVIPSSSKMSFLNMMVSVEAKASGSNNNWTTSANGAILKGNTVGITKEVEEGSSSTTAKSDAADAQIGESVTYTITVDVPHFAKSETDSTITFTVKDVLTNVNIDTATIKIYGVASDGLETELTNNSTAVYTADITNTGYLTIDLSKDYMNTFYNNGNWPYVTVKIVYTAELDSDANINSANTNTATLTWDDSNHNENTASDSATVYTYQATVTKTDDDDTNQTLLQGAEFCVTVNSSAISFVKVLDATTITYKVADANDIANTTITTTTTLVTGTNGMITLLGLDSGKEYVIKETKAPSGYTLNSNVLVFSLIATEPVSAYISDYTTNEYTDETLDTLVSSGSVWSASGLAESSGSSNLLGVALSLTDTTLPSLPATGSVGIIVFTIAGVAIMILALVLINSGKSKQKKA